MKDTGLIKYDAMVHAIAICHEIDEVKDIRDKAVALEKYAQLAMNTDAERQACDIRLRAERKAGQMLSDREMHGGDRKSESRSSDPTLKDIGITRDQSSKWQKLAAIPEQQFESALADPKKPSTAGIIRKANGSTTQMDADALWIWGRLREMESKHIFDRDTDVIFGEVTDAMSHDFYRILPLAIGWLQNLEESFDGKPKH